MVSWTAGPLLACLLAGAQEDAARLARDLVEKLGSDSIEERERAAERLRGLGTVAIPELERGSRHADPEIANRAARLLRIAGLPRLTDRLSAAVPGLEERLLDGGEAAWTQVFLQLADDISLERDDLEALAPGAVRGAQSSLDLDRVCHAVKHRNLRSSIPEIVRLIERPDETIRGLACSALASLEAREAVADVAKLLAHGDPKVRLRALDVLPAIEGRAALPQVRRRLLDRDGGVRGYAAIALGRLAGWEAAPALLLLMEKDPDSWVRVRAAEALAGMRLVKAAPAIARLLHGTADTQLRRRVLGYLSHLDARETWPEIAKLVDDPDGDIRSHAVRTLAELGAKEAIPAILKRLEGSPIDPRWGAGQALAQLKSPEIVERLLGPFENVSARVMAIEALGAIGTKRVLPDLVRALEDPYPQVREAALGGLAKLRAREAAAAIAKLLDGPQASRAVDILLLLEAKECVPQIEKLLGHEVPQVRAVAARALGRLADRSAAPRLLPLLRDSDAGPRIAAMGSYCEMLGREAVPELLKLLVDPAAELKGAVACELANLGAKEAVPRIEALIAGRHQDSQVLLEALAELGAKEAVPRIRALLQDPELAVFAAAALDRLGETDNRGALLEQARKSGRSGSYYPLLVLARAGDERVVPILLEQMEKQRGEERTIAAALLCRIGRRDGVQLLVDRERELASLNAVRRTEEWKRLRGRRVELGLGDSGREVREKLERACGMPIITPGIEAGEFEDSLVPYARHRGHSKWCDVLDLLCGLEAILETDHIRVLRPSATRSFWRAWWETDRRRPGARDNPSR
jgi:HEAT repeat protein